jgi:MerR family transcriptional regulator, light-induced transcriptional regulator
MRKTILSTVDVARLFDVTVTTVKRWADDGTLRCHKTPGGHRKFPIKNVVEFAERHRLETIGVLELPRNDVHCGSIETALMNRDFPQLVDAFVEKALSPDRTDLYVFFSFLYEHQVALWEIFDNILRPGMTEIGLRWQRGEIGVNQEHRASYETLDALARLQSEVFVKPDSGKSVVLACPDEEMHEIGLRSISYTFEAEGWTTHYVGAGTPPDAIVDAVRELRPSIMALSVTRVSDATRLSIGLREIIERVHALGVKIVVGGRGLPSEISGLGPIDAVLTSAHDVVDYLAAQNTNSSTKRHPDA